MYHVWRAKGVPHENGLNLCFYPEEEHPASDT